ncbi:MAG: HDIG domain-containing protein [Saprospiraceae bacterium]|nr:HDIG domain-containing protein [Candidatus Vicinibacter affinis]
MESLESVIHQLFNLYFTKGQSNYFGENVSQLEHASQTADLAIQNGADDEQIIAAFFHDVGHLCAPDQSDKIDIYGIKNHEDLGGEYLKKLGFSNRIVYLIKNHVQAKRYLTFTDPVYLKSLSHASLMTLKAQGGPMTEVEAVYFEMQPDFKYVIALAQMG